jgi:hypothetical protein
LGAVGGEAGVGIEAASGALHALNAASDDCVLARRALKSSKSASNFDLIILIEYSNTPQGRRIVRLDSDSGQQCSLCIVQHQHQKSCQQGIPAQTPKYSITIS